MATGIFRSLDSYNFRVWSAGAIVSNIGAWMQRVAQDWLVLNDLTHHDARAVGVVVALQFCPQVLLLPWTGWVADNRDRRRTLILTQGAMAVLALSLGLLTIGGIARTWHVFVFAFLLGCATAFDSPTRQTFVAEMVGDNNLSNAVALNSTSFNASRLIGPAVAGLLIAAVGSGWVFMINAVSFVGVLSSLACIRKADLNVHERPAGEVFGGLMEGLRYVAGRRDLQTLLAMLLVFGAIGLNFPIYLSTIALVTFKLDARGFGFLTSAMAIGSLGGALLAARRARPTIALIALGAFVFGVAFGLAAIMPTATTFAAALIVVGACSQTVTTSTTSLVQLSTDPPMRGRVMAILLTVALGGQPLGAPLVGWIANQFGPRCAVLVGAASGIATALMGTAYLWRARRTARTGKPSR